MISEKNMTQKEKAILNRSERLFGTKMMEDIQSRRIIIFGVGGVGSWCAEALVRSGIKHLTLVDSDLVCITNCNRQLMATAKTIGQVKVEALRSRLLEINPEADIVAVKKVYSQETASEFELERYDYVIDAIDSLRDKISLILHVTSLPQCTLISSMGAALRIDPTKIRVSEFWKVKGDPLAAAMRSTMRKHKLFPGHKFLCVHSEEQPLPNLGDTFTCQACPYDCPDDRHDWNAHKPQANGSLSHITGIFGMTIAGLVIQSIQKATMQQAKEND